MNITKQQYEEMLMIFNTLKNIEYLIITWHNGLKVKCSPFLGMEESDTEPEDEDYIGEYYTIVDQVEILEEGRDDSIKIDNDGIEINIFTIPDKIETLDGTVLWGKPKGV